MESEVSGQKNNRLERPQNVSGYRLVVFFVQKMVLISSLEYQAVLSLPPPWTTLDFGLAHFQQIQQHISTEQIMKFSEYIAIAVASVQAAVTASDSNPCHTDCLNEFKFCSVVSIDDNQDRLGCARKSAFCRQECRGDHREKTVVVDRSNWQPFTSVHDDKSPIEGALHIPDGRGLHRILADGSSLPVIPFGFYQYENDFSIPFDEHYSAMSLTAPYVSSATADEAWFSKMDQFMDDCASIGFLVHFQLIAFASLEPTDEVMANITAQVERYKEHPALFAWYLSDEPDGSGISLEVLQPKYDLIKKLDPNHPVSMVFCAGGAANYMDALDLIMVDTYPIPGSPASSIASSLQVVHDLGKPIMFVPQSFGGGENWARSPSIQEERLMGYISLLYDCLAIQYFVRDAPILFPTGSTAAWNEIQRVSLEISMLASALAGGTRLESVRDTTVEHIKVGTWEDRDESIVMLAINLGSDTIVADSAEFQFDLKAGDVISVESMFEPTLAGDCASVPFVVSEDGVLTITDTLRGMETRAYRINTKASAEKNRIDRIVFEDDNMVYNPSFEINVNPGVTDGFYIDLGGDDADGSFYAADNRLSHTGRTSMRLTTVTENHGIDFSPYTLPKLEANTKYTVSVFVKGAAAAGGEIFQLNMDTTIFVGNNTSLTVTATNKWTEYTLDVTTTDDIDSACPYGCRKWARYFLHSVGTVWIDSMSVVKA